MSDVARLEDLEFKTTHQVEAFARWYLRRSVGEVQEEFSSEEERQQFARRRLTRIYAEVDQLHQMQLSKGVTQNIDQTLFHIGADNASHPLATKIDSNKNSRFNFPEIDLFRNQVIYFGANRRTCYVEKFHLPIQRKNYAQLMKRTPEEMDAELPKQKYRIWTYNVKLKNVLVLTSETTLKAAGIAAGVVKNEWYSVNDEFDIPTAGQILAAMAREAGFSGIMYESVRNQTKANLVVFLDNTSGVCFDCTDNSEFDPSTENDDS